MADESVVRARHLAIDALNIRRGGGVTVRDRLARAFADRGCRVTVLTRPDAEPGDLPAGGSGRPGKPAGRIEVRALPGAIGPIGALRARQSALEPILTEIGADALLGFNFHTPTVLPQLTYHINVIPYLTFTRRRRAVGLARALLQPVAARRALARSDLNYFESRYLAGLARRAFGRPIRGEGIAYIGVDGPDTGAGASDPGGPLVSVTSGAAHKRNDLLLAAYRRLRADEAGLTLHIVGSREALLAGLGPEDRAFAIGDPGIVFTGYLDRAALFAVLAGARCLLTFSELESFYMVALEAMKAGCPVVAADTSSIAESIGPAGLLFPAGDAAAAADRVGELARPGRHGELAAVGRDWAAGFDAGALTRAFAEEVCGRWGWTAERTP